VFRPVHDLKKIVSKRKNTKKKLKKIKKHNTNSKKKREMTTVRIGFMKNIVVDAETYFTDQMDKLDAEIKKIQHASKKKNLGFAFVSFKSKECVYETIEEIDLVKQNLMRDQKIVKLGI
jgi:RNA recognition motif-containing protein